MLSKESHSAFIDRVNKMVDEGGKSISAMLIKKLDLNGFIKNPKKETARLTKIAVTESAKVFKRATEIGDELMKAKEDA